MSTSDPFFSARLKVKRAEHHIRQLERIERAYIATNVKAMRANRDKKARKRMAHIGTAVPLHTPTIAGDAIHNLRCSLDHAYIALVEANGRTPDRWTTFPFFDKRANAVSSINGKKRAGPVPKDAVLDYIFNTIKPFEDEGSELYDLHQLDIADKHHLLLATEAVTEVERLPIGDGASIEGFSLVIPHGNDSRAIGVDPGLRPKLKGDAEATFAIRFIEGGRLRGERVLQALKRLHILTSAAVEGLSAYLPTPRT